MLPLDNRGLVREKYAGWNGVLRIWIAEGWQAGSGSLVGWLNRCGAEFEKAHNGVYVQITAVAPEQLRDLRNSVRTPDGILFCPGMLENADDLIPLPAELPVRENLRTSYYAVPVALGGYAWVVNEDGGPSVLLPADDSQHAWPAALLALSAGGDASIEEIEPPGVDLGLPVFAPQNPSVVTETETPFTDFAEGSGQALVATQREIVRLKDLSAQGKGVDWTIDARSPAGFTDQLLFYGIPECGDEDAQARQALALEFMMCLLGDDCQAKLSAAGAFPVTEVFAEYPPNDPLASLDIALRDPEVVAPPAFGNGWRQDARLALGEYLRGEYSAAEAFGRLFGSS